MARYHCDKVSEQLQQVPGVKVTDITRSSWTFSRDGAKLNLRVMPGCCGILLVYQLRGKAKELNQLLKYVISAAKKTEFGAVLLSLTQKSELLPLIKKDPTWKTIDFRNPRTTNVVEVLIYTLPYKEKKKTPQRYHED